MSQGRRATTSTDVGLPEYVVPNSDRQLRIISLGLFRTRSEFPMNDFCCIGEVRESAEQGAVPFRELSMLASAKDGAPAWRLGRQQALF
jgi:hypothetical protein